MHTLHTSPVEPYAAPIYRRVSRRLALVAVNAAQARAGRYLRFAATIHNGIPIGDFPFSAAKGDYLHLDLDKLQAVIDWFGAERIPYISVETNVNMAGGQPLSMANLKATYELCRHEHDVLLMLDATRALENAYFTKQREAGLRPPSRRDPVGVVRVLRRRHPLRQVDVGPSQRDQFAGVTSRTHGNRTSTAKLGSAAAITSRSAAGSGNRVGATRDLAGTVAATARL